MQQGEHTIDLGHVVHELRNALIPASLQCDREPVPTLVREGIARALALSAQVAEQERRLPRGVSIADMRAVIVERDRTISDLIERNKALELQLAQAIAREKVREAPKGFVSAKKRRKHEHRVAKAAVQEARRV